MSPILIDIGLFVLGCAVGYGVREFISYRRRTAARQEWLREKGFDPD
jgi:hypothetical protein